MSRLQHVLMASTALMAAVVATSGAARAQATAQPPVQASTSTQLEEITVAATSRPERLDVNF